MADLLFFNFESLEALVSWRDVRSGLKIYVNKANQEIGTIARKAMRDYIRGGKSPIKNAPTTVAIKGFNKPLYRTGTLASNLQKMKQKWHTMYVGIIKDRLVQDPDSGKMSSLLAVAETLHEGKTIKVTDAMRGYFYAMSKRFPKRFFPIPPQVKSITIPSRPFLLSALDNALVLKYQELWANAVEKALLHKTKHKSRTAGTP